MNLVLEHFELKRAHIYNFSRHGSLACLPPTENGQSEKQIYALNISHLIRIVWRHDPVTGRTDAFSCSRGNDLMRRILLKHMTVARHSMFPALVASIMLERRMCAKVGESHMAVVEVESRTQHQLWDTDMTKFAAKGDYAFLSSRISGIASICATLEFERSTLDDILNTIAAYGVPQNGLGIEDVMEVDFKMCVRLLKQRSKNLEMQLRHMLRRAEIQLQAVSHCLRIQAS